MIFEEAPRPAGSYSHALVANGFAIVADQDPGEVPSTFTDQARQSFTSCGPFCERGSGRFLPREAGTAYAGCGRYREETPDASRGVSDWLLIF
jgi:hypothetical protein